MNKGISDERRQQIHEATERARAVLKPGDRRRITRCGGIVSTVTFVGFADPPYHRWICSKTLEDIAAVNIIKLNGKPVDFTQEDYYDVTKRMDDV